MAAVLSVQMGAAVATTLFDEIGPSGAVLLRTAFAAVILVAIWRPRLPLGGGRPLRDAALLGVALAGMNLSFYAALDRIPLGIAVTLEFTGPFAVAVAASRRASDLLWVGLAGGGILLLSPGFHGSLDGLGVAFALVAGTFWAAYIVLAARVGQAFRGGQGLALAMVVAAALLVPVGVADGGELGDPGLLAVGLAVAVLSSAIPYSLELEALRRLQKGTFGVLMSLEPAVAALVGLAVLGQGLSAAETAAIILVVTASAGALSAARAPAPVET